MFIDWVDVAQFTLAEVEILWNGKSVRLSDALALDELTVLIYLIHK